MTSRKLPSEIEESASKRRRVHDERATAASFDRLNTDCMVNVFSFLPVQDLNTVALCSKGCCEARNNESLDQARTGTIILKQNSTPESVNALVVAAEENGVFSGNCTTLKIDGVERMPWILPGATLPRLSGVTKLKISQSSEDEDAVNPECLAAALIQCPNATDIDLNNVKEDSSRLGLFDLLDAAGRIQNIERFTWNGCSSFFIGGYLLSRALSLTELCLDDTTFATPASSVEAMEIYGSMQVYLGVQRYMLQGCRNLQRVSIKGATLRFNGATLRFNGATLRFNYGSDDDDDDEAPLAQEIIIKLARLHPHLRWLRSDLSEENMAMLKEERPEITFVSE